ncbi:RDD family protein [Streptomyces anandii]|uniref:RDD family protein n=1 Tax=Streptomyces anandii TaxID=285454 RepID=UPI0037976375
MSAPTPAPGDDRPREGYYPDPSIPGYVRYWNGASWVPGTSRPAPGDGEPLSPPPGVRPAQPVTPAAVEETGPHFFDEDPVDGGGPVPDPAGAASAQHGSRPEPASAWGADRSLQSGFGGDQDRRVSWGGGAAGADPRAALAAGPGTGAGAGSGSAEGAFPAPGIPSPGGPADDEGTMTFRAASVPAQGGAALSGPQHSAGAPGFAAGKAAAERAATNQAQSQAQAPSPSPAPAPAKPAQQQARPAQQQPVPQQPVQQQAPAQPAPHGAPAAAAPVTSGPGGGQSSWAQQVHQLAGAGEDQPVVPWKPPVEDPFQAVARRQAAARPAGLGRRLAARLVDSLVLAGVTAVAAVPLGVRAVDHVQAKIDAARLSGRTVTVWLLDGTTAGYLGVVVAVLLIFGVLYEALPTAKWGRTLGKKLCGLQVRDIEAHEPPGFGAALRRWLVYSVPGLLGIGLLGVLWCLFDRPWHQCWHDKAAHTFVAG